MQNRRQFLASSYLIWAVLLAAFIAIGAREVWIGSRGVLFPPRPFGSTDAYLKELLQVPNASERCAEMMRQFAGNR